MTPAGFTIILVCHLQWRRLHGTRHVLPFLQIAGNRGWGHHTPYQGFLCYRQWVRNHRARGRAPTFTNSWARRTTLDEQETHQSVLSATKALAKMTNCNRRAINLNNFLYKNKSGTLVAIG